MKRIKILSLLISLFITFSYAQKAELITQQINVENAIRGKVENTVNKFLDVSQYIVLVNARLEFKPMSMGSLEQSELDYKEQNSSPYSLIPGLDMPGIPTKQNIYQSNDSETSFEYSTEKYYLYSLDITIYIDDKISTGSLQQNIKTLVRKNIPEIADCDDCIKFETINFQSKVNNDSRYDELLSKIELLEQDRRDAEMKLQNWRFEQLEDQLASSEDARSEWEGQARDRDNQRREEDATRLEKLQNIENTYRDKQDSLYILTSIKLDEALRGRIVSEENTKKELLGLIKMQIQGEDINGNNISDNTRSGLYTKKPSMGNTGLSLQMWLLIVAVGLLTAILILTLTKNKKTVYLKPKADDIKENIGDKISNSNENISFGQTQANQNTEVQRSELQTLRQSAVSMSVSEKDGANQIVQDWLNDGSSSENNDNDNNNEDEKK